MPRLPSLDLLPTPGAASPLRPPRWDTEQDRDPRGSPVQSLPSAVGIRPGWSVPTFKGDCKGLSVYSGILLEGGVASGSFICRRQSPPPPAAAFVSRVID